MAQRDKVKELVGKGLHSYHTKSLQQIDRIEKKNKEQNHKISILSNELDNDYLTKTEEGSVVSLEHSKEGMVYLDELQGNTLVNYCTDGSKEMTLNGDIDVEGTFVTTTEGVDSGKIDVMCEGNTLVNVYSIGKESFVANGNWVVKTPSYKTMVCKPSTLYTFVLYDIENTLNSNGSVQFGATSGDITYTYFTSSKTYVASDLKGIVKFTLTSRDDISDTKYSTRNQLMPSCTEGSLSYNLMILEGDWTNKEVPSEFFIGMKSVGQDDENGHKIEILSQNKNLCTVNSYSGIRHNKIETNIPCKKNTIYTLTFKDESDLNQSGSRGITLITHKTKTDKNDHGSIYTYAMGEGGKEYIFRKSGFTFNTSDCCYISLTSNNMTSVPNLIIKEIQIEEGSQTSYNPHTFNKKEILLNEPLRSLPNGVKDKIVKIGGKYYVEKNCGQIVLDGSENWVKSDFTRTEHFRAYWGVHNWYKQQTPTFNNILPNESVNIQGRDVEGVYITNTFDIQVSHSKLNTVDLNGLKQWLSQNHITVIYQLNTPIYEPIETDISLLTYLDTTHISNNSTIPCNMKIKNSGYNAIIKPSTLYTVALDTNKSGTVGINLGGAKVTTTNNVVTVTTPATLTDDSLRLHGKGIKASKVRLLEGDKTNWIPSHFEGMKSCFEDKLQDDGTYKMEISSKNKNLFTHKEYIPVDGLSVETPNDNTVILKDATPNNYKQLYLWIRGLKANVNYIVTSDVNAINGIPLIALQDAKTTNDAFISKTEGRNRATFKLKQGHDTVKLRLFVNHLGGDIAGHIEYKNIQIREETTSETYEETKSNKIQFSSIEPLRKWDRLVFNDGHLMIERGTRVHIINNETKNIGISTYGDKIKTMAFTIPTHNINENDILICKDFTNAYVWDDFEHCHSNKNIINITINRKRLLTEDVQGFLNWLENNPITIYSKKTEPTYEEIPFELQKIILEGYENGTLFFDTNIPPTSTVTYAGETPIVKSVRLNKTEVLSNTEDINDNIIPYLMDMDYRVVMLQLATEELEGGVSMARLFGGTYEMIKRDILSKRLTREEYGHRLADYFNAGKLTEEQVRELEELR